jgi:hypothetical protein
MKAASGATAVLACGTIGGLECGRLADLQDLAVDCPDLLI